MYVSANLSGPDLSCIKADFQVWSLTGGSNLEEGFLESLAGRLLGFVASALAGFVAAMALLAPVCRFVEASAHTLLVVVLTKEWIEYFLQT